MTAPVFSTVKKDDGSEGVTYTCGCPCVPTAAPTAEGPGMEHCCCGKVHVVGRGAEAALTAYLADRKAKRKREPEYERGTATATLAGAAVDVAWAFPIE